MGSYDGKLYGLDAADRQAARGSTRPRTTCTRTPCDRRTASRTSPAATRCFTACDVADGEERCRDVGRRRTPARRSAMVDGVAYFGTFDNQVLALDIASRKVQVALRASRSEVPVLFVGGGGRRHWWCSAAATGWCARSTRRPARRAGLMTRARIDSSPAIAGDRVVVGSNDGRLYVLDLATGKEVWEFDAGAGFTASPALASAASSSATWTAASTRSASDRKARGLRHCRICNVIPIDRELAGASDWHGTCVDPRSRCLVGGDDGILRES